MEFPEISDIFKGTIIEFIDVLHLFLMFASLWSIFLGMFVISKVFGLGLASFAPIFNGSAYDFREFMIVLIKFTDTNQ